MNRRVRHVLLLTATVAAAMATPASAQAEPSPGGGGNDKGKHLAAIGLTADQRLVTFSVENPRRPKDVGAVSGLDVDTALVGIDYRVQDGLLYGVGNEGGIYTFTGATGTKVSQLTVDLEGTAFGVDFNPALDRLRIISSTGQNLNHNLANDTTTEDNDLTYPPTTTAATGLTAAAYTNNDLDPATGTTLYDLDTALNQAVIQSPPASGLLVPIGSLGVDPATDAGFDIHSRTASRPDANGPLTPGPVISNKGFATLSVEGSYRLYRINLFTGAASQIGAFPAQTQVTDLAVQLQETPVA